MEIYLLLYFSQFSDAGGSFFLQMNVRRTWQQLLQPHNRYLWNHNLQTETNFNSSQISIFLSYVAPCFILFKWSISFLVLLNSLTLITRLRSSYILHHKLKTRILNLKLQKIKPWKDSLLSCCPRSENETLNEKTVVF